MFMKLSPQEILAGIIFHARMDKGYSQRQLSALSGVSHTEISKLEKGERLKPQPSILKKLSDVLALDYQEVMEAIGYLDAPLLDDGPFPFFKNQNTLPVLPPELWETLQLIVETSNPSQIRKFISLCKWFLSFVMDD